MSQLGETRRVSQGKVPCPQCFGGSWRATCDTCDRKGKVYKYVIEKLVCQRCKGTGVAGDGCFYCQTQGKITVEWPHDGVEYEKVGWL